MERRRLTEVRKETEPKIKDSRFSEVRRPKKQQSKSPRQ